MFCSDKCFLQRGANYQLLIINLFKESLINNCQVDCRLIIVWAVEDTVLVFCLDCNLWDWIVVQTKRKDLLLCISVQAIDITVEILVMSEDIELLIVFSHLCRMRKDIISYFDVCDDGMRAERRLAVW